MVPSARRGTREFDPAPTRLAVVMPVTGTGVAALANPPFPNWPSCLLRHSVASHQGNIRHVVIAAAQRWPSAYNGLVAEKLLASDPASTWGLAESW
jgi:hypothetical protein